MEASPSKLTTHSNAGVDSVDFSAATVDGYVVPKSPLKRQHGGAVHVDVAAAVSGEKSQQMDANVNRLSKNDMMINFLFTKQTFFRS